MKRTTYTVLILLILGFFSSCLKQGLPEYENWELNSIQNVYIEHRFETSKQANGQPIIGYQRLNVNREVDEESGLITLKVTVPNPIGDFTEDEREKVVQNNLWMYVDLSTAATIRPLGKSPKLGDPVDLTKEHQYEVTAANGDKKVWRINVVEFNK